MTAPIQPDGTASAPILRADATRLKGLGHPLRVTLLDHLYLHGPATASILAERLGESSGATSYHLRQLERHGFIEEDPTRGTGKERWWRRSPVQFDLAPAEIQDDPAALEASYLIVEQFTSRRSEQMEKFLRRGFGELGPEWVDSSSVTNAVLALTVDELRALSTEVIEVLQATVARYRGRERPDGSRTIVVQFHAFPLVDDPRAAEPGRESS